MEKILINKYGYNTTFDTVSNSISMNRRHYVTCVEVRNDGLVITGTEVIDVNKGDYLLLFQDIPDDNPRVVVISDKTEIHDLDQIFNILE